MFLGANGSECCTAKLAQPLLTATEYGLRTLPARPANARRKQGQKGTHGIACHPGYFEDPDRPEAATIAGS